MLSLISRTFAWRRVPIKTQNKTLVRGDFVEIISGKEKGKQGKIMKLRRNYNWIKVQGCNLQIKHIGTNAEGVMIGRQAVEGPIHISNVLLVDPETSQPTKIKRGFLEDGTKVRISKRSGAIIEKPAVVSNSEKFKAAKDGDLDTKAKDVQEQSYQGEDFEAIKQKFQKHIEEKEKEAKWLVFTK